MVASGLKEGAEGVDTAHEGPAGPGAGVPGGSRPGITVTSSPAPDQPNDLLHPRLTVAHVPAGDQARVRRSLVVAAGSVIDLSGQAVALDVDEVSAIAAGLAAERAAERRLELGRAETELRRALEACDEAGAQRDAVAARIMYLLDTAAWCDEVDQRAEALAGAVRAAAEVFDSRRAQHREARERLERVLEQRAAAAAAIEVADRELGELDGASLDETGVRRELEAANRRLQEAIEAEEAARSTLEALEARRVALVAEAEAAVEARGRAGSALEVAPVDDAPVRDALRAFEANATFAGSASIGRQLLRSMAAVEAELATALAELPPPPLPAVLEAARAEVAAAEAALAELDAAAGTGGLTAEQRAEIDAIHEAVLEAEDKASQGFGRAAARRRLEQLRAEEQAVLERHGYGSHLEVVLSGGRPGGGNRLAAEQRLQAAQNRLGSLEDQTSGTPDVVALRAERDRLRAEGIELLGTDPADRFEALLEEHPDVPQPIVTDLVDALRAVGVAPVGVPLDEAARAWLAEQSELQLARREGRARLAELDDEITRCTSDLEALTTAVTDASTCCEQAGADLDAARRKVAVLEGELAARAGEDARRLQRLAAAEQLRAQVEAVERTLVRAEAEARAQAEALAASVQAAELAWDRAEAEVAEVIRRLRRCAEELPEGRTPQLVGEPVPDAAPVAAALREEARRLGVASAAADAAVDEATAVADRSAATVTALRSAGDGPMATDHAEALERALQGSEAAIVLDDSLLGLVADVRAEFLTRLVDLAEHRRIVLLTAEPEVLGWAIELPAEHGMTVPAARLVTVDGGAAAAPRPTAPTDHASAPVAGPSQGRYR
jgi:hypothetical protein